MKSSTSQSGSWCSVIQVHTGMPTFPLVKVLLSVVIWTSRMAEVIYRIKKVFKKGDSSEWKTPLCLVPEPVNLLWRVANASLRDRQQVMQYMSSMTSVEGSMRPRTWVESGYRTSTAHGFAQYLKDVQHTQKVQIKPLETLSKTRLYIDNHQNSGLEKTQFPL